MQPILSRNNGERSPALAFTHKRKSIMNRHTLTTDEAREITNRVSEMTPEMLAKKMAPYGKIERGMRKSKPTDLFSAYVWRMIRFLNGSNTMMPMTAEFWVANGVADELGYEHREISSRDDGVQAIVKILDGKINDVAEVFGENLTVNARRWHTGLV